MSRSGAELALLLLGGYRRLVGVAIEELAVRGYDVTPTHDYAMRAIDAGASNASDLGRRLAVSKQAALRTITVLVERGWVERADDPVDGRRMVLRVSEEGHRVLAVGEQVFDDLRAQWERRLGRDELAHLEELLALLVGDDPVRPDAPGWIAGSV
ncbi:winged helix DNA-binding protein [Nocardioides marinquilinus]|uniref:Winged helix DNA-binding protein n=1 Tax=Nocardioides marinquilinus TaxID=1210400 RepID=A0ABP9P6W7_9ACTN